jgi:hypothetical protein
MSPEDVANNNSISPEKWESVEVVSLVFIRDMFDNFYQDRFILIDAFGFHVHEMEHFALAVATARSTDSKSTRYRHPAIGLRTKP